SRAEKSSEAGPGSEIHPHCVLFIKGLSTGFRQRLDVLLSPPLQLFSIVIFGCIANEGYINRPEEPEEFCIFNRNQNACNYGVFMGSMAFLCCVAFLALDVYFPQISSVKDRKKAVLADVGLSAFWSFMWFVGFCLLANQWQVSKLEDNPLKEGGDAARAAITFSFFSIFTWAGQSFLGFQRYKLGADSALFSQEYTDPSQDVAGAPYTSFGGDDPESPVGGGGAGGGQANGDEAFDGTGGYQRQDY
uniref:synaptogyrin-1a n=1 Tax=Gasterosteus aculeatus aculeatus TaxID=481459 RepID=UPI001A97D538